jgi:hypothetical protein
MQKRPCGPAYKEVGYDADEKCPAAVLFVGEIGHHRFPHCIPFALLLPLHETHLPSSALLVPLDSLPGGWTSGGCATRVGLGATVSFMAANGGAAEGARNIGGGNSAVGISVEQLLSGALRVSYGRIVSLSHLTADGISASRHEATAAKKERSPGRGKKHCRRSLSPGTSQSLEIPP